MNQLEQPGATFWAIADGYIPRGSHGEGREFLSHETACILNVGNEDAHIEVFIYHADRAPVGPYRLTVQARRTFHMRFNDLKIPEPIALATDYSAVIISDVPVIVQHTRLDTRQAESALFSTIAYS